MNAGKESHQARIRFPDALKRRIQAEAEKAGRSMNAEVVIGMTRRYEARDRKRAAQALKGAA